MENKKRVTTRLTMDEARYTEAMASTKNMSVSSYLKYKLFEPKVKMDNEQRDQVIDRFSSQVNVITICRIQQNVAELLKMARSGSTKLTDDEFVSLLDIQQELGQIRKGIDQVCRLCL